MICLITAARASSYEKDGQHKEFGELHCVKAKPTTRPDAAGLETTTYQCDFETASLVRQSVPAVYELDLDEVSFNRAGQKVSFLKVVGAAKVAELKDCQITGKGIGVRRSPAPATV